jgi:hypothetical protein
MLIFKGVLLGMALFLIGAVMYMLLGSFLGRKLIRARGIGIISANSPFLWLAFAGSLAIGYFISVRGMWVLEGLLLGGVMFIVGTLAYGIAYNRHLQKSSPHPPGTSIGISVRHLYPKLLVALICSLGLGLAIVAIWPKKGIPVP